MPEPPRTDGGLPVRAVREEGGKPEHISTTPTTAQIVQPFSNMLMAIKNRSSARGEARIRWPVAADSQRDGAIIAKIDKPTTDATG